MKVDPAILMRVASFPGQGRLPGDDAWHQGRFVVVSPDVLSTMKLSPLPPVATVKGAEISIGDIVYVMDKAGKSVSGIAHAGQWPAIRLTSAGLGGITLTDDPRRVTDALKRGAVPGGKNIHTAAVALLEMGRSIPALVGDVLAANAFLDGMAAGHSTVLSVSHAEFVRKIRANLARHRITSIDPEHEWAVQPRERPSMSIFPMTPATSEVSRIRNIVRTVGIFSDFLPLITRASGRDLIHEVVSWDALEETGSRGLMSPLSGAWVQRLPGMLLSSIGAEAQSLRPEIGCFSNGEFDLMIVREPSMRETGISIAVCWPTRDRLPLLGSRDQDYLALSKEEIPSLEEVTELEALADELQTLAWIKADEPRGSIRDEKLA